jgi:hypothetical protein
MGTTRRRILDSAAGWRERRRAAGFRFQQQQLDAPEQSERGRHRSRVERRLVSARVAEQRQRAGECAKLRGGVGRFTQASYITGGQNGFSRTTLSIVTQDNYLSPYDTLNNPFRGGVLEPTGGSRPAHEFRFRAELGRSESRPLQFLGIQRSFAASGR